eukprot:Anaeramoba_flamelloidesa87451_686.p1 GENE.a87451_686~~a87451_686.p1  ORF type:complete len:308 (-),score=52.56 a87451_686:477-1400(-)
MDCCVIPLKDIPNRYLVQTTDFFYPSVDDPYKQGQIACANTLSDLYAMGVTGCDNMLMLLGVSLQMNLKQQDSSTIQLIKGFNDTANKAGTYVRGGQTVFNPWTLIGGVATRVCKREEIILPENAKAGDVLILTKPLGIQITTNMKKIMGNKAIWKMLSNKVTKEAVDKAIETGVRSMTRLNLDAAKLMHKYDAHAATDITGFGLMGHSQNLAVCQTEKIGIKIHTLPIIKHTLPFDKLMFYGLTKGKAKETSGGLLISINPNKAQNFIDDLKKTEGYDSWIIGEFVKGERKAQIIKDPKIVEVLYD